VSDIDLLKPASGGGDVGDPGIEDALDAGELEDNLVGKLVGDTPKIFCLPGIFLTHDLFPLIDVKEAQLHRELFALQIEPPFDQPLRTDDGPISKIEILQGDPTLLRMLDVGRPIQRPEPARQIQVANDDIRNSLRKLIPVFARALVLKGRNRNGITLCPGPDNRPLHLGIEKLRRKR
jgi:hypothetical protein